MPSIVIAFLSFIYFTKCVQIMEQGKIYSANNTEKFHSWDFIAGQYIEVDLWRTSTYSGTSERHPLVKYTITNKNTTKVIQSNGRSNFSSELFYHYQIEIDKSYEYSYNILFCSPKPCHSLCPYDMNGAFCSGNGACINGNCSCDVIDSLIYYGIDCPKSDLWLQYQTIWIVVIVLIILLIFISLGCIFYSTNKKKKKRKVDKDLEKPLIDEDPDSSDIPADIFEQNVKKNKELVEKGEINAEEVFLGQVVGSGSFSVVYEGTWRDQQVAVKVLKSTEQGLRDFILEECSIMIKLNHPNIVKFMGACLDPSKFFIITEYLPRGSLSKLMSDRKYKYEIEHIRKFLLDTCRGMAYLHQQHIIHRDLKPGNLLITLDWSIKVADFGLSRALPDAHLTQTLTSCGTITYTAPEVLRDQRYSLKADLWSFGIIALSLITRNKPYPKMTDAQIVIRVLGGKRPRISSKIPKEFQKIIRSCLEIEAKSRPSFRLIVDALEKVNVQKSLYPNPIFVKESSTLKKSIGENEINLKKSSEAVPIGSAPKSGIHHHRHHHDNDNDKVPPRPIALSAPNSRLPPNFFRNFTDDRTGLTSSDNPLSIITEETTTTTTTTSSDGHNIPIKSEISPRSTSLISSSPKQTNKRRESRPSVKEVHKTIEQELMPVANFSGGDEIIGHFDEDLTFNPRDIPSSTPDNNTLVLEKNLKQQNTTTTTPLDTTKTSAVHFSPEKLQQESSSVLLPNRDGSDPYYNTNDNLNNTDVV